MTSLFDADYYSQEGFEVTECYGPGIPDCAFASLDINNGSCAIYDGDWKQGSSLEWAIITGGFVAAFMAFGIGANDAANAWATAVGSGALPLRFAVLLGGVFEWAGAMALAFGPAKTVTKGSTKITDENCYACGMCDSNMTQYGIGMFSALLAGGIFLMIATFSRLPVSTTHAIIGATVGATVMNVGTGCLSWTFDKGGLGGVIASWFISPVLSGSVAVVIYMITKYTILYPFWTGFKKTTSNLPALYAQPIIAALHTFVIVYLTLKKAAGSKKMKSYWQVLIALFISFGVMFVFGVYTFKYQKKSLPSTIAELKKENTSEEIEKKPGQFHKFKNPILRFIWNNDPFFNIPSFWNCAGKDKEDDFNAGELVSVADNNEMSVVVGAGGDDDKKEAKEVEGNGRELSKQEKYEIKKHNELLQESMPVQDSYYCFKALLIYAAIWDSFSHGANDTGNATGAFAGIQLAYEAKPNMCEKGAAETPVYIMAIAGAFMFIGIVTLGQFVIKTIGKNIAFIDYHIGFCVEFASTIAVIIATILELPVSTTHCQVGAILFVGLASDWRGVNWKWFGAVSAGWLLTVPIAGLFSAGFTAAFREAVRL